MEQRNINCENDLLGLISDINVEKERTEALLNTIGDTLDDLMEDMMALGEELKALSNAKQALVRILAEENGFDVEEIDNGHN